MEYSLNNLNLISNLKELTLSHFINSLNLIGLEIDGVSKKKIKLNSFYSLENIKILIKIPANREDLLIEDFFLQEISTLFFCETFPIWKKLNKTYGFVSKQKYTQYFHYSFININSELPSIVTYAIELEKFKNKSSPLWIQNKLNNVGIEVFNNFNDILNLVMFEWGQTLNSAKIENTNSTHYYLKRLEITTNFIDSSGKSLELLPGTIVLKNKENNILTILGLFNFIESKSYEKNIILETSFYDIEKNSLFINVINPKISLKYFRKMFLEKLKFSFQRVLTLVEILGYCSKLLPLKYSTKKQNILLSSHKMLLLRKKSLQNIIGNQEIDSKIFEQAGLKLVCQTTTNFYFKIPNSRKDITREIDLIEEYTRFFGYKNFSEVLPLKTFSNSFQKRSNINFLKELFLSSGFYEIITNSLQDISMVRSSSILLSNPLNKELYSLRESLLPKILDIFSINLRVSSIATNFFEIGRVFSIYKNQIIEENKFAGIFQIPKVGNLKEQDIDWFSSLGFLESILSQFGYNMIKKEKISPKLSIFHPTRSILLTYKNKILGVFGEINPRYENYNFLKKRTYCFELNLIHLNKSNQYSSPFVYNEYSKYPKITKDISVLVKNTINFQEIKNALKKNIQYLKIITFFDIYFDKTNNHFVNLGIRIDFQSFTETLTSEKIDLEIQKSKNILVTKFEGKINE